MCRVAKYEMVAERVQGYNSDVIDKHMNNADNIAMFIMQTLQSDRMLVEHFYVFMLDTKLKVMGFTDVSKGTLDSSPVHPREVFAPAIMTPKTAAVIAAHVHPSGDPTPSRQDIEVTERLNKAADILGIRLLDHVIVGDRCFTSMRSEGYII
ncbi:MAG: hypothetical protein IJH64_02890 [Oscillospiraceae bacterium]|nr:hypothetical protein [Oscillospiraceae bacterium]